jgi:hypothetical protein
LKPYEKAYQQLALVNVIDNDPRAAIPGKALKDMLSTPGPAVLEEMNSQLSSEKDNRKKSAKKTSLKRLEVKMTRRFSSQASNSIGGHTNKMWHSR